MILKLKKSMEKYRRVEIDYEQLQDELEDAGIFKDGKFLSRTNAVMSKKELFTLVNQYIQD